MNKSSFALKVAIPLAVFSLHSFLQTQVAQAADGVELTESGLELTITANRREEVSSKTLAPNTVITQEDIQTTQATTVAEVLRRVPGISISNSGGVGKATSVFIRGTNSGQLLVLIDGVRHGSATLGSTAFQHLAVEQIERIEVVRGPRSSLYGSDSLGGVIQIFTKKGSEGFTPSVKLSAGTNDTYEADATLSGGNGKTSYSVGLQAETTDGIDACNSTTSGCFADEPDDDGYNRRALSLNIGHAFTDKVKSEFTVFRTEGDTEFDGNFQNEADFIQQALSAKVIADVTDSLALNVVLGQSRDDSDNFKDGVFSSSFNTKRNTVSLTADYSMNLNNTLLFGADFYDDIVSGTTDYDVTSRNNTGVFGSYSTLLNNTQLDVSLRYDDNEQFGSVTTGGIAVGQKINDTLRFKASYGTAFKAPTFNQLYFPFDFGNPDLAPEESKNYELGLEGSFSNSSLSNLNWELNVFQNDIEDLIQTTADFSTSENIATARVRGVEAVFNFELAGFDVFTNITAQKPESASGVNDGKVLRLRPERILNIDIDRSLGDLSIGSTIHAESERFTNADNSAKLGGFATLDFRADYQINKNWNLGLKIGNVLDKEYATNQGFNQDGINGLVSVRYSPK